MFKSKRRARRLLVRLAVTLAVTLAVGCVALLCIYPFLWMLSTSFKFEIDVFDFPFKLIPENWNFGNYLKVFQDSRFPTFYLNSIIVTVASVAGNIFLSSAAAYAFARLRFKGRNVLFMLFMVTLMIPLQVVLLPKFVLFQRMGLYNTHAALILPGMISAFTVFFLRQAYRTIPMELSESAQIDGASQVRIYWQIVMPLARGPMITMMVMAFITSWNDYMQPLLLLKSVEKFTIPIGLEWFSTSNSMNFALVMAGTVCALVPILLLFVFTQRFYIESLATSGLKG